MSLFGFTLYASGLFIRMSDSLFDSLVTWIKIWSDLVLIGWCCNQFNIFDKEVSMLEPHHHLNPCCVHVQCLVLWFLSVSHGPKNETCFSLKTHISWPVCQIFTDRCSSVDFWLQRISFRHPSLIDLTSRWTKEGVTSSPSQCLPWT